MQEEKRLRLAEEALQLKKAWLLAVAILGANERISAQELVIRDYGRWPIKALKRQIGDLEDDFRTIATIILEDWKPSALTTTVAYFSARFDEWHAAGLGLFDLGRVHDFEQTVWRLGHRKHLECPPYAQLLLQGYHGAAIRHPEYHLAQDLALLYNLFLDSEAMLGDLRSRGQPHHAEHSQSLARSVILACFNLLESFVSGLAAGWLIENPNAPADKIAKLKDDDSPLRKRFLRVPSLITGKANLIDNSQPPIRPLFEECKQRRDSFVHCVPGSTPTKQGYVKEERFHDVEAAAVRRTVDLTLEAISLVWKAVHARGGPRWLPGRDRTGRFERVNATLRALGEP